MPRSHLAALLGDEFPSVGEDLTIAKDPIPIEKENHRGPFKDLYAIFRKLLVERRRQNCEVSDSYPLCNPDIENLKCCNREEKWHSYPIHKCDINDIDYL